MLPLEISLALGEHEGEPCVRLVVPSRARADQIILAAPATLRPEAAAGPLPRPELLAALAERLATPAPGGMRCLALVRIDKFGALERVIGATASEEVITEVARLLKETLTPREVVGRFGGVRFLALLERGNEHDISAWSERLLGRVQRHVMRINDKSIAVTCHRAVDGPGRAVAGRRGPGRDRVRAAACPWRQPSVASDRADTDSRVMSCMTRCG